MISTTVNRVLYSGDGTTTAFAFPYKFNALKVILKSGSTESTQTSGGDYTLSGAGSATGGTVSMVIAPAATQTLVLYNDQTVTQTLDLPDSGSFQPSTVETQFDKMAMQIQRLRAQIERAATLRETDASVSDALLIPFKEDRTSSLLGFDASCRLTTFATNTVITGTAVSAFASTMLDDTSAGAVLATLELTVTAYAKTILDDANESSARVTLGFDALQSPYNLGFGIATVSQPGDALIIRGRNGDLGTGSILSLPVPNHTNSGLTSFIKLNDNVTISILGAHWGYDTYGDLTNAALTAYAFVDSTATTGKYGISRSPFLTTIASSNATPTATSATSYSKMVTNATITAGTWSVVPIGYFLGNFDDAGGAEANLWTLSSGPGMLFPNRRSPIPRLVAIYETNVVRNMVHNADTLVDFEDKIYDPFALAVTGSSWKATSPVKGTAKVHNMLSLVAAGGWTTGETFLGRIYKNGVDTGQICGQIVAEWSHSTANMIHSGCGEVPVVAGDYITIYGLQNSGGDLSLSGAAGGNRVQIEFIPEHT